MRLSDPRVRSTVLINAASVLEKCDEQILPAVFSWVGASFNATPAQLGNIALGRALMQALSSPIGGVAGHFFPRGRVIAAGCVLWACMELMFSATTSLWWAIPIVSMNGVGLALVIPNVQSLTADFYPPNQRGKAFGALWLTISIGGMLGALYATNMAAWRPFGLEGWRFVFISVAVVSATTGVLNALFVQDPAYARKDGGGGGGSSSSSKQLSMSGLGAVWGEVIDVMKIPTFLIIIVQGIIGSVPYASLVFLTLYFQLLGMTNAAASGLVAIYLAGGGLGGLLGGYIGDRMSRRYPNHGRIAATQFSVLMGVPFAVVLFRGLPLDGEQDTVAYYAVTLAAFAVLTAWPAPCANNPIFAEIVPVQQRNLVYSFDRCFEGAIAAFAVPLVGLLAQKWFGFEGTSTVTGNREKDVSNARALGSALLAFLTVPWALCFCVYGLLHWTYPRDKHAALVAQHQIDERSPRDAVFVPVLRPSSSGSEAGGSGGPGSSRDGSRDGGGARVSLERVDRVRSSPERDSLLARRGGEGGSGGGGGGSGSAA